MLVRMDSAFVRGLTQGRLSRRQLLRGAGGAVAGAYVGSALAACGIAGTRDTGAAADYNWSDFWNRQQVAGDPRLGQLAALHRPKQGQHPSIDEFTEKTGIQVNYKPVIQDNASFFAQISPVLQAGAVDRLRPGRDHRWLGAHPDDQEPVADPARPLADAELLPLRGADRASALFDPKNTYTVTWQSGITGIAYDTATDRAAGSTASATSSTRRSRARSG